MSSLDYVQDPNVDRTRSMPDLTNRNIIVGYWHNWPAESGQGCESGRFKEMALTDIPKEYNVIAVAFMKGNGIPTFAPYKYNDDEFRRQIEVLNSEGRAVLISLGGANANITLYAGQERALASEIIRLVETYGFDGLDVDLEQSAILAADNVMVISEALRVVKDYYRELGQHFVISMAPEFPHLRTNGPYAGYIRELEGYYDFIAPQFYNQGGDGVDVGELNEYLAQNNDERKEDFLYYLTDSLVRGTRGFVKIPFDKFVIGLPSNRDAADNGYVINPDDLKRAVKRLEESSTPIKGIMTWSVNWDAGTNLAGKPYGWEFMKRYGSLFGEDDVPDIPSVPSPKNLRQIAQSETTIALQWEYTGTSLKHYTIYRDGIEIARSKTPTFTDVGLIPGNVYRYYATATSGGGATSASSEVISASTDKRPNLPDQWVTTRWYGRGAAVTWQDAIYECVQEHTSNQWWAPHLASTLWAIRVSLQPA